MTPQNKSRILIIGMGVSGLTTAICLQRRGYKISLVAEKKTKQTVSSVAGALWEIPPAVCGYPLQQSRNSIWKDQKRSIDSYKEFLKLEKIRNTGVNIRQVNFYFKDKINKNHSEYLKIQKLKEENFNFNHDPSLIIKNNINSSLSYEDAYSYDAPIINTDVYLEWLFNEITKDSNTKVFYKKITGNINQLKSRLLEEYEANLIVNCSGLGSLDLTTDPIFPVRGGLIYLENNGIDMPYISEAHCTNLNNIPSNKENSFIYILPRGDNIVALGGIAEPYKYDTDIQFHEHPSGREILQKCTEFMPSIRKGKIINSQPFRVGLRPFREQGVRLEADVSNQIIHNYGHGGAGVLLSWGCAKEVVSLADSLLLKSKVDVNSNKKSTQAIINEIADQVNRGECVVFVGAGLSAIDNRQPSTQSLVRKFIEFYFSETELANINNEDLYKYSFPEIAQEYYQRKRHKEDIQRVADDISKNFLGVQSRSGIDLDAIPSVNHLLLASCGIKDVFTTNYDTFLEKAYRTLGFAGINIIHKDNINGVDQDGLINIYKFCGTARNKGASVMQSQFDINNPNPMQSTLMRCLINKKSIIFIGYSMNDENIVLPYFQFSRDCLPKQSYCVMRNERENIQELENEGYIVPIYMDAGEFLLRLRTAIIMQNISSDTFNSLSKYRRDIENSGMELLIEKLRVSDSSQKKESIDKIEKAFENYLLALRINKEANLWYYDFLYHKSFYSQLYINDVKENFVSLYFKLRLFNAEYQSQSTLEEHKSILSYLKNEEYDKVLSTLQKHLCNSAIHGLFWIKYINKLCSECQLKDVFSENYSFILETRNEIKREYFGKSILLKTYSSNEQLDLVKLDILYNIALEDKIPVYIDFSNSIIESELLKNANDFKTFLTSYFTTFDFSTEEHKSIVQEKINSKQISLFFHKIDLLSDELIGVLGNIMQTYQNSSQDICNIFMTSTQEGMSNAHINISEMLNLQII